MNSRILTMTLSVALALGVVLLLASAPANVHLPDYHIGYEPRQPIAYSHRLHAGELGIPCLHCHGAAERSRNAGIPTANVCMNCHRFITAPSIETKAEGDLAAREQRAPRRLLSPELAKLYEALALDSAMRRDSSRSPRPVVWARVHNLPSYVYFNHSAHVGAGVTCQSCHGPVESMERVRQFADLSMGWCVNCHRDANANGVNGKQVRASTDCDACHH